MSAYVSRPVAENVPGSELCPRASAKGEEESVLLGFQFLDSPACLRGRRICNVSPHDARLRCVYKRAKMKGFSVSSSSQPSKGSLDDWNRRRARDLEMSVYKDAGVEY